MPRLKLGTLGFALVLLVAGAPGVQQVRVDVETGAVTVIYDDSMTTAERLAGLLKAAGFPTNGQDTCQGWRRWFGRC